MKVTFLYFEDCPSHEVALERLRSVMAKEGIEVQVNIIKVETEEQAHNLQFTGSPTIRINSRDIDPPPADAPYRLACRAYQLEDGRISPLPSAAIIRRAFQSQDR
jgi:hypothetical protein